mmetsp:Transcript_18292/g.37730  ORF Transcript_18292/g.37730 Transcript_18292/m.37730 type:complete len:334 (-) Transcript_18292:903-1904(-)
MQHRTDSFIHSFSTIRVKQRRHLHHQNKIEGGGLFIRIASNDDAPLLRHARRFLPRCLPRPLVVIVGLTVGCRCGFPLRYRWGSDRWRGPVGRLLVLTLGLLIGLLLGRSSVSAGILTISSLLPIASLLLLIVAPLLLVATILLLLLLVIAALLVPSVGIMAAAATTTTTCVGMIWTGLDDFAQHILGHFDALALSTQRNLAISARWNVLVDLNVGTRSFLEIIDCHTLASDYPSHVVLCGKEYLGFLSTATATAMGWPWLLIGLTSSATIGPLITAAAIVSTAASSSVRLIVTTIATTSRLHVLPAVGKIGIGWSGSPDTTPLYFVVHEHAE